MEAELTTTGGDREERLRFLESVVENANDAILVTEATPVGEPGPRIVYVNETFTRATGYTLEDVVGKTPRILQGPSTERGPRDEIREALEWWRPVRVELLNYRKDGTPFWVELNIVPVFDEYGCYTHWVSVQRDVTERRREEEERRKREENFRASLARNASDVAWILDEDGTIRYASPSTLRILGHEPEDLVGESVFSYVHEEDADWLAEEFDRIAGSPGAAAKPLEYRFRHEDGRYRYVESVGNNLLADPGVRGVVFNLWDVTERRRVEDELLLKDRAIASSSNGIVITDATLPDNPVTYVNRRFEQISGYSSHEILGFNCRFLAGDDRDQPAREELRIAIDKGREWSGVLRNYRKNGDLFWNELSISPVRDKEGRLTNYIGVLKDITDRKRLEERLAHQAFHDPLTDLPNRALFMDRVGRALARGARRGERVAVLFMDLDNFKYVNDSLGHEMGDDLLKAVAERITHRLRPTDTAARLGGDEFTILLEDVEDAEEATRIARRIIEALKSPFSLGENGQEVFVTTSIGIALGGGFPDADGAKGRVEPKDLLRDADLAMYRAKDLGKDHYEVFESSMNAPALERLELESDLRRAVGSVDREDFVVHYQPKVDLRTGHIVGAEALVRWEHPERGLVPPDKFIPLAEETGLILPIGHRVLEQACRQAKEWQPAASEGAFVVSVNLSARQLQRPDLIGAVRSVLSETGLDPKALCLEITESVAMGDADSTAAAFRELKSLGVCLAIDDFGTGHSSLSYLKRFPVDVLKIDRSFVDPLDEEGEDEVLVSAMIGLAGTLGLTVVAEGVETAGQLQRLEALGCDLAQGYYFAKPLPAPRLSELLLASHHPATRP